MQSIGTSGAGRNEQRRQMKSRRHGLFSTTALIPAFAALAAGSLTASPAQAQTLAQSETRGGDGGGGGGAGGGGTDAGISEAGGDGVAAGSGGGGGGTSAGSPSIIGFAIPITGGAGGSGAGNGGGMGGAGGFLFTQQFRRDLAEGQNGGAATENGAGGGGGGGGLSLGSLINISVTSSGGFIGFKGGNGGVGLGSGSGGGGGAGGSVSDYLRDGASSVFSDVNGGVRTGGAGGDGGAGGTTGNGGGGGNGGAIFIVALSGVGTVINRGTLVGGAGGNGGLGVIAGRGGIGGVGLNQTGGSIDNLGTLQGGNGGTGSVAGAGGIGLIGTSLTLNNTGTIAGGLSGDGVTRALAMRLSGTNTITNIGTLTGGVEITSGTTTFDIAGDQTLGNIISGAGSLTKAGAGNLTLTGANTHRGGTSIEAGTLVFASARPVGNRGVSLNGGALRSTVDTDGVFGGFGSGIDSTMSAAAGTTMTFSSSIFISGNDAVPTIARFGTLADTGTIQTTSWGSSSAFRIIVQGGTLSSGGLTSITSTALSTQVDAGALLNNRGQFGTNPNLTIRNLIGAGTVRNDGGTTTINAGNFGGVLDGTQNVRVGIEGSASNLILSGNNTYTGTTTIFEGNTLQIGNGGTTGTLGGGAVTNNGSLTFNRSNDFTVANLISGTGSLTKTGAGNLTLTAANTYTGLTTVAEGTLTVGNIMALGTADAGTVVNSGATLALQVANIINEPLTINGNGFGDGGALRTVARNILGGAITLGSGSRINNDAGQLELRGAINSAGFNLTFGSQGNTVVSGNLSLGTGQLIKDRIGIVELSGTNVHGDVTINGGQLSVFGASALADGALVTINGGELAIANSETIGGLASLSGGGVRIFSAQTLSVGANNTSTTFAGTIGGFGALTKIGTGNLTLSGANTYSGLTFVSEGTLTVTNSAALGSAAAGTRVVNGATLAFSASLSEPIILNGDGVGGGGALRKFSASSANVAGPITLGSAARISIDAGQSIFLGGITGDNRSLTFSVTNVAAIENQLALGAGRLIKEGSGTLVLNTNTPAQIGELVINDGAVQLATDLRPANTVLADTVLVTINGGRLNVAASETIGGLSGNATSQVFANGAGVTLTTGGINISTLFAGSFLGTVGLTKQGSGTLILAGANTSSGTTTISGGILQIGNGGTTGTLGTGSVVNNGTLMFHRSDALAFRNTISGSGRLTKLGAGNLTLTGTNTYSGITTILPGTLQIGDGGTTGTLGTGHVALVATTSRLVFNRSDDFTATNIISDTGSLTKLGAGNLTLTGANTYSGLTTISEGTLTVTNSAALGSAVGGTIVQDGATLALSGLDLRVAEAITLNGSGVNNAGALQVVTGGATITGAITLGSAARINANNGRANIQGGITGADFDLTIGGEANFLIDSQVSLGRGRLFKDGLNALTLNNTDAQASEFVVQSGSVVLGSTGGPANRAINDLVTVKMNGGNLVLIASETIGSLSGSAGVISTFDGLNPRLITGGNNDSTEFGGILFLPTGLTKEGTGTLTLTGLSTNSGVTTINGGTLQIGNGGTTGTLGNGGIENNASLVFNRSNDFTVSNIISGTGSLTKLGAGNLTLRGANTYSGLTTVSAGTLTVGNNSALGTQAGGTIVANGATLAFAGLNLAVAEAITLNGSGVNNAGALRLIAGSTSLTGAITLGSAARINADLGGGALTLRGGITGANSDLTIGGTGNAVIASALSLGGGRLVRDGSGILVLSNLNTDVSELVVGGGQVQFGLAGDLANLAFSDTARVTLDNGGLVLRASETIGSLAGSAGTFVTDDGSDRRLTIGGNNDSTTFAGSMSQTLGLTKEGTGTLTLTGVNSNLGGTIINGGTLAVQGGNAIADRSAVTVNSGAALQLLGFERIGGLAGAGQVLLGANDLAVSHTFDTTFSGVISGSGGLFKSFSGSLTLTGANTFTGRTVVLGDLGQLVVGATGSLAGGVTVFDGGSFVNSGRVGGQTSVQSGGALVSTGTLGGGLSNAGRAELSGLVTGTVFTTGSLTAGRTLTITGRVTQNSGIISLNDSTVSIGSLAGTGTLSLIGASSLTVGSDNTNATYSGEVQGLGPLIKVGTGTLTLDGANSFSGGVIIDGGTLRVANPFALARGRVQIGSGTSLAIDVPLQANLVNSIVLADAGSTILSRNSALTGTVSGGQLNVGALDGTNFLVLAGNNTYGATNLADRARVQVGFGGTSGTLGTGAVTLGTGSVLSFSRSDNQTLSNVISGSGSLQKFQGNTLTLTGGNTAAERFTGLATVVGGTLLVNGTFGDVTGRIANVQVAPNATLGGSGTIAGNVIVNSLGILSPGNSAGTLNILGNLRLANTSIINFELARAGVIGGGINDLITVGGNLNLAGTANIIGLPGFGEGIYRLINYGGTFTNSGFNLGLRPDGFTGSLITSVAGQVSVQFIRGLPSVLYWDGADAAGSSSAANGNGGAGTWNSTGTNWTFAEGFSTNLAWGGQTAIFGGAAGGIVQIGGDQAFQQLRFTTGGYTLTAASIGGSLVTAGGTSIIDVATGLEATVNVPVTGMAGLTKAGAGVLNLGGVNTYGGLTSIAEGTLVLTAGGAIAGPVENNATFTNAGTVAGAVTNRGTLTSTGSIGGLTNSGTATLSGGVTGAVSNSGTITLAGITTGIGAFSQGTGATLDLAGFDTTLGSLAGSGAVQFGSAMLVTGGDGSTSGFDGTITGTGGLTKTGAGMLTLAGLNTFTGLTAITAGELAIAAGGGLGGEVQNSDRFTNAGTIGGLVRTLLGATTINTGIFGGGAINSGTLTSTGSILGDLTNSGIATLAGRVDGGIANAGTITLSGALGVGGTLDLGGALLGGVFDLADNAANVGGLAGNGQLRLGTGTITINGAGSTSFAGAISGTGALIKTGTGTLTLSSLGGASGVHTFAGLTSVESGALILGEGASLAGGVQNSANFVNAGTVSGLVQALAGATTTNTGIFAGGVTNGGTLTSTGSILGGLTNSGTASLSGGVTGAVSNSGTITLAGITTGIGAFSQDTGATLNLSGFDTTLGSLAGSGAVQLGSATLVTGGNGSSSGFDGTITGTGGITKTGGGTFTLSGANAYAGLTTVSQGVLALRNAAALGSAAGGTLVADGAGLHLQGNLVVVNEALTLNGNGVAGTGALRNLAGNSFWGGTVTLASDSSIFADAGRIDIVRLAGGSQGLTTGGGTGLVSILDATTTGKLTVTGGGTSLFGNGSFAGGVTVTGGALFVQGGTSIADSAAVNLTGGTLVISRSETIGSLSATGGTVQIDGGQTLTFGGNGASTGFAGLIFSTGNLVKQGAGTFTVTGRLLHAGTTAINGGTVLSGAADIWRNNGAVTIAAGAALDLGGFAQRIATINLAGGTLANGVLAGAITSVGGTLRDVTGANSLLAAGGTTLLAGAGDFAQGVTLAGGNVTLQGAGSRIADTALVTVNAGILGIDGSETIGALAGSGGQVRIAANQTLTTGGNGASTTYAGAITGSGNLTKSGAGVMTLDGANTLSGLTTVGAGTLALTGTASLAGPVQNNAGLTNAGTIGGLVTNAGTLLSSGRLDGGLVNSGSAGLAGQLNGTVANSGLVQLQGVLTGITAFDQTADGRFDLANIGISIGSLAGGGSVSLGAAILTLGGSNASTGFGGTISGSGGLVKTGSGTFTLTGGQAFTGLTTVSGGTLAITGTGGLSGSVLNNATLQSAGVLLGSLTNTGTALLAGRIDGGIANSGLITLSGLLRANGAFTQTATGVLDLAGAGALLGSLAGEGQVRIGSGILTTGTDNTSTIFAGVISGTGAFTKLGTGTLTLTGVNTFSGLTTIDSGTLVIGEGASPAAATSATATTTTTTIGRVLAVTAEAAPAIVSLAAAPATAPVAAVPTVAHLADAKANVAIAADAESGRPSLAAGFGLGNGLGAAVIAPASASAGVLTGAAQPDLGNNMATATIVGGGATVTITDRGADQAADPVTGPVSDAALPVTTAAAPAPGAEPVAMTAAALPSRAVLAGDVLNNAALINNGTILGRVINSAGATAVNNGTIGGPVGNAGTFTSIGTLSGGLSNTGTARLRGVVTGEVFNAGSITLTGATTGMTVLNQTTSGRFDLGGFDTAIGAIAGGGTINLGSARLTTGTNGVTSLFEGVIAGSGSLFKAGTGGLILSGDNLYTGGTTIAAGVLQIGNGGTTGSILGAVVNNGTLIVNRSNAYTLAGAISGTGTFVQAGSGTTTLTGANTYTGGTLVSGGRLIGSTTALQGLIQNDAALEFAQAANGVFAGRIFGSGLLDKSGAGLLELTGDSSGLRGVTTVRAGELRVTGSLAGSATTVLSGATLSGNGTLGGLIARSGATIAPGADGLGMLGVNGAIQLQSGSTVRLQVRAANGSDMLIGNGTLQVGGTAAISNLGGTFAFNSNYLLLQASGGRTGTFDAVTGLAGFGILYRPELVYTNTQVLLRMAPNLLANIVGTAPLTFNQRSVVSRIDAAMTAGYNPQPLFAVYTLAAAQQAGAFDQLSGESYTTAAGVGVEQERLVREAVLGRVAAVAAAARLSPEAGTGPGAWGQVLRSWGDGDSDGNAARHENDRDGFITGIDYGTASSDGSWRAGAYGFHMTNRVRVNAVGSRVALNQTGGGVYAAASFGGLSFGLGGSLAGVDLTSQRNIALPGFTETNRGFTNGRAIQTFAEVSYTIAAGKATFRPFVGGAAGQLRLDALTESGGAAALSVGRQRFDSATVTAGADGSVGIGKILRLSGTVAGRMQIGESDPVAQIALAAAPGQAFAIRGIQLDRFALATRLDATVALSKNADLSLGYTGLIGKETTDHGARATISVRF